MPLGNFNFFAKTETPADVQAGGDVRDGYAAANARIDHADGTLDLNWFLL